MAAVFHSISFYLDFHLQKFLEDQRNETLDVSWFGFNIQLVEVIFVWSHLMMLRAAFHLTATVSALQVCSALR